LILTTSKSGEITDAISSGVFMDVNELEVRRTVVAVLEQCSACKQPYELGDTRVVERQGEIWVLSVCCACCSAESLVAAVVDEAGVEVETFDRPDYGETPNEAPSAATVDDVLDMHQFLESFDGDFQALFRRHKRRA
jgi:hypothetical protein